MVLIRGATPCRAFHDQVVGGTPRQGHGRIGERDVVIVVDQQDCLSDALNDPFIELLELGCVRPRARRWPEQPRSGLQWH